MKLFTLFFLLISFYSFEAHSRFPHDYYNKKTEQKNSALESERTLSINEQALQLENQIDEYMNSVILLLLSEDTPSDNKIEIIEVIRSFPDRHDKYIIALTILSEKGPEKYKRGGVYKKDRNISAWVINQSELLKNKQLELAELILLNAKFYKDLIFNGAIIVIGGGLFFVPGGQAVSIPLIGGILTLTGKQLGVLLASIGVLEITIDNSYFFSEDKRKSRNLKNDEQKITSFASSFVIEDNFTRALIIDIIGDGTYPQKGREFLVKILRSFSDMEEDLRREAIETLKSIIDKRLRHPSLRKIAVSVLGEIGEGMEEVAEYLIDRGDDVNENDLLRLIALIELGRNKDYFLTSIEKLSTWFEYNKDDRFTIRREVSDSFVDSLLTTKEEEVSENHISVVKGLIFSGVLYLNLKLKFSEALLKWDDSIENKALLRELYLNSTPIEDINFYLKERLFKERGLYKNSYEAYQFFITELSALEKDIKINPFEDNEMNILLTLLKIESIIHEFKEKYPDQIEIALKLENIVDSYQKIMVSIQKKV